MIRTCNRQKSKYTTVKNMGKPSTNRAPNRVQNYSLKANCGDRHGSYCVSSRSVMATYTVRPETISKKPAKCGSSFILLSATVTPRLSFGLGHPCYLRFNELSRLEKDLPLGGRSSQIPSVLYGVEISQCSSKPRCTHELRPPPRVLPTAPGSSAPPSSQVGRCH